MATHDYEKRSQAARRLGFASYHARRNAEARALGFRSYWQLRKARSPVSANNAPQR